MLKRFKRMVVGLDGSDHAQKALEVAIELARINKSSLVLVHALNEAPLTPAERELAETEFGMKDLGEKPPVTAVANTGEDPRLGFTATPVAALHASLRARTEMSQTVLDEIRQDLLQQGIENIEFIIEIGEPADVVLAAAQAKDADLIVIGSRGLSDLQGLVFGSTSHKVAHRAPCTCLTVS
ncbi:MAG TPA: universal stress protein [Terriglobales bacterium]|jgi:nucleotide-binding universal stress UspA family protein|nr:universal stress protein [Terriglobales bacterium]